MRRANRLCLAKVCLAKVCLAMLCLAASLSAAPAAQPTVQAGSTGAAEARGGDVAQAQPRVGRSGERRRHSYAFCNRESHKRDLRGGARRRFLIRCKLGLERRQSDRSKEPAAPGRRP